MDLPRLRIDNSEAEFKGIETKVHSTWLEVVRQHVRSAFPLLRRDGFLIANCGDLEAPYVRIILNEAMGVGNHVATIVWQRSYAPRNMRGMTEFTSTHDFFIVFAVDRVSLRHVGLQVEHEGFANSDGDPRGPWKAEHKGAATRRDSTDFSAYVPPYRWRLIEGALPPGLWRVSPLTGVIWGNPTVAGTSSFKVEVSDSKGVASIKAFKLAIDEQPTDSVDTPSLPWLFKPMKTTGPLKVSTSKLPKGAVGQEYSAVLLAEGGTPYSGPGRRPGKGRYYEFADRTLEAAYLRDNVKDDGKAIPHPKTYLSAAGGYQIRNQQTWWPGRSNDDEVASGYTQDATRHLKKLEEAGLISRITNAAKPEPLIGRLLDIFSDEGDLVLEVFGEAGDLSAVAAKKARSFLFLAGESDRDRELADQCSIPRLRAVVAGKDHNLESLPGPQAVGAYIPFSGGGAFAIAQLGEWFLLRDTDADYPEINRAAYGDFDKLKGALLTTQGFVPTGLVRPDGLSWDGQRAAIVVPPDKFLSESIVSEVASALSSNFRSVTIFYFRSLDDFEETFVKSKVLLRRVPFELTVYAP
jgi:DNA-binding transcriptional ArsR family regulator